MDELTTLAQPAPDFDRLAAALQADSRDLHTFIEVVAFKFAEALPERTRVERQGGLLSRNKAVHRVSLDLGAMRFQLERSGGQVLARCTKVVRGIALKTEDLGLDDWLHRLAEALQDQARASSQDRVALERLLG
ncbi:MAG: hypothetical protein ACREN4_02395 [Candidatus Dormibacteria bacterium]